MLDRGVILHALAGGIAEAIKLVRRDASRSWSVIDATVRYTAQVTKTPTGEIEPALFRGGTIYRFISDEKDEYGYPLADAFYEDEGLTILIANRHD